MRSNASLEEVVFRDRLRLEIRTKILIKILNYIRVR